MPRYKLVSFDICPFVQRSAMTLAEKQVEHTIEYIDLANKPEWFLDISPLGKVPLLIVEDGDRRVVLFESAVINEYLDEVSEGTLLPSEPLARARQRALIELASAALGDAWRMGTTGDRDEALARAEALRAKLGHFEREWVGPLFTGDSLSLVDTAAIPLLQRAAWTGELAPELEPLRGLPNMRAWLDEASQLTSVAASAVPDLRERYRRYLGRKGGWVGQRVAA